MLSTKQCNRVCVPGRNDPFTKCLSIAGSTYELSVLAEIVVRSPRTVPHEIRMEWDRHGGRVLTYNNQLPNRR